MTKIRFKLESSYCTHHANCNFHSYDYWKNGKYASSGHTHTSLMPTRKYFAQALPSIESIATETAELHKRALERGMATKKMVSDIKFQSNER